MHGWPNSRLSGQPPLATSENSGAHHDLVRLIRVLDHHCVDYLLAGGAAARAYGAKRLTEDADCVVRRERDNLDRLVRALRELNARLRVSGMSDDEARLLPVQIDGHMLERADISTWMTDAGASTFFPASWPPTVSLPPTMSLLSGRTSSTARASRSGWRPWTTSSRRRNKPIDRRTARRCLSYGT